MMNTRPGFDRFAFPLLLFCYQSCMATIMDVVQTASEQSHNNSTPPWVSEETGNLVDHFHQELHDTTEGRFKDETVSRLVDNLNGKYAGKRTPKQVYDRLEEVRTFIF
jgi:predicted Zn-dependent protease